MYEIKKNGKVFTSKSVGTGPSSYEKIIYRAAVSQRLRNNDIDRPSVHVKSVYMYAKSVLPSHQNIHVMYRII